MRFYADPETTFSPTMQARLRHHFQQFQLATLYGMQAAQELAGMRLRLSNLRQAGGSAAVTADLLSSAQGWAAHSLNCWQHAMFEALATDPMYVVNV